MRAFIAAGVCVYVRMRMRVGLRACVNVCALHASLLFKLVLLQWAKGRYVQRRGREAAPVEGRPCGA